jgi:hypothetical protein
MAELAAYLLSQALSLPFGECSPITKFNANLVIIK